MDPDQNSFKLQSQLEGFFNKIKNEKIRNKFAVWQKYLVNASARFKSDSSNSESSASSTSTVSENQPTSSKTETENENVGSNDVYTPSDSGTIIFVSIKPDDMDGIVTNPKEDIKLLQSLDENTPRNKSPVQQWVDSLPLDESIEKVEGTTDTPPLLEEPEAEQEPIDAEVEGFTLGAEAVGVTCPRPYPFVHVTNTCGGSDAGSHCSSMESLLESRKPDPEEVLLELGFAGAEDHDRFSRIPSRFLQPSVLKGVAIDEFLKHQQLLVHTYESGFSGYRGLAGPFNTIPSGIVGKIMEKLREAEVGRNSNQHHRHNHMHHNYKYNQSVLSADNRKWLERQGVSPEPEGRRIVLGEKTFTFAKDGDLIEGTNEKKNGFIVEKTEIKLNKNQKIKENETEVNGIGKDEINGFQKNRIQNEMLLNKMIVLENKSNEITDEINRSENGTGEEEEFSNRKKSAILMNGTEGIEKDRTRRIKFKQDDIKEEFKKDDEDINEKGESSSKLESIDLGEETDFDNDQLEIEYKTVHLLANQLKGSDLHLELVSEDVFYKLCSEERNQIERSLVENALYTYQQRLKNLDLRAHLKEYLSTQVNKVSKVLNSRDQEWINVIRQMTTLLRHQETLRQTLRATRSSSGNTS